VKYGSKVITDEHVGYDSLRYRFVHDIINHSQTYVKGQVHTQGIENFWSLLKRTLRGTYVAVEPFHLVRSLDEQVYRFNHRKDADGNKLTDADRFNLALPGIVGRRLTFAESLARLAVKRLANPYRRKRGRKPASEAVSSLASRRRF